MPPPPLQHRLNSGRPPRLAKPARSRNRAFSARAVAARFPGPPTARRPGSSGCVCGGAAAGCGCVCGGAAAAGAGSAGARAAARRRRGPPRALESNGVYSTHSRSGYGRSPSSKLSSTALASAPLAASFDALADLALRPTEPDR